MPPGTYLRKRREAAGIRIGEVARQVALMSFGIRPYQTGQILFELVAAEDDRTTLSPPQTALLQHVFPFDRTIYGQLVDLALADPQTLPHLPQPRICTRCACSWNDPCRSTIGTSDGSFFILPCAWTSGPEIDGKEPLCSACAHAPAPGTITIIPTPTNPAKEPA
ncbi:hypothetical protein [Qipengyuania sp.]|uniref:hypothetical protein n=1 Tax=Qipengyuania sp. TaxID=2004515 RepID=UPI0035C84173